MNVGSLFSGIGGIGAPHLRARIFILAYPNSRLGQRPDDGLLAGRSPATGRGSAVAHANGKPLVWTPVTRPERDPWATEPDVGRVADGVPARVDRLRGLGNSVVPQIAEWIGRRILEVTA